MYFKIALGNIKKSYKDYGIYFLTLILAISIFYSFDSVYSQKALTQLSSFAEGFADTLRRNMSFVSLFISIVLAGLIVYANNFLVKKRKNELGIYMCLGMGKEKISRILIIETLIVGIISLVVGIVLGILISQGLSLLTLKIFDVPMNEYQFIVSSSAISKTTLYFGIMFLLVMIFNVVVIFRYKIIDLITAGRKNENISSKNPFIYLVLFIMSLISIGFAYKLLLGVVISSTNSKIAISLIIGGTILFFFSLSGFILCIVKKNKKIYLKGLNIFVIKQLNSKVKTNFISMSLICLMLFTTIVMLSTGISFKVEYEKGLEKKVPYDASVILYNRENNENIEDVLKSINFKMDENENFAVYNQYSITKTLGDIITFKDEKFKDFESKAVNFVKISDYNKILKLRDKKQVDLNKDEALILIYNHNLVKPINEIVANNNKVNIEGKNLLLKSNNSTEENLKVNNTIDDECIIVVNDEFLSNSKVMKSVLNVNYLGQNREKFNDKYNELYKEFVEGEYRSLDKIVTTIVKDEVYSREKEGTATILFIGIYVGIVFLIASMAVLSLQQLSEASDSTKRYKALSRIGANEKMINKTIFKQTLIYFSLPMILALVHSSIVIPLIGKEINRLNQIDITYSVSITLLIFIVIYAIYFYTTYVGYKNIVKNNI